MQEIVNAYKDKGDANGVKQVQSTGLHVAGERFVVLKADDRSIYGKKVSGRLPLRNNTTDNEQERWYGGVLIETLQGREGVVIVKTTQAILVTHYPETIQPGAAANTVEQLGDYLVKVGY